MVVFLSKYPSGFSRVVVAPSDFRFSTEADLKVYGVKYTVLTGCFSLAVIVPSGGYGPNDMAALGATLGVLLCACLAIMAFLIIHIRRDRGDWKKLYEVNQFRSTVSLKTQKLRRPKVTRTLWDEFERLCPVLVALDHQMKLSNSI